MELKRCSTITGRLSHARYDMAACCVWRNIRYAGGTRKYVPAVEIIGSFVS